MVSSMSLESRNGALFLSSNDRYATHVVVVVAAVVVVVVVSVL